MSDPLDWWCPVCGVPPGQTCGTNGQNHIPRDTVKPMLAEAGAEEETAMPAGPKSDGYEPLREALKAALLRASEGKGRERHGGGLPFLEQPIMQEARLLGIAPLVYQIRKKAREAITMSEHANYKAARAEMEDAIVYSAAVWLRLKELES